MAAYLFELRHTLTMSPKFNLSRRHKAKVTKKRRDDNATEQSTDYKAMIMCHTETKEGKKD
jgi:hypothetical protein